MQIIQITTHPVIKQLINIKTKKLWNLQLSKLKKTKTNRKI